jgi:hypothetical protein
MRKPHQELNEAGPDGASTKARDAQLRLQETDGRRDQHGEGELVVGLKEFEDPRAIEAPEERLADRAGISGMRQLHNRLGYADEVARPSNFEDDLGTVLEQAPDLHVPSFDEEAGLRGLTLMDEESAGPTDLGGSFSAADCRED